MTILLSKPQVFSEICSAGKTCEVLPVDVAAQKAFRAAIPVASTETLAILEAKERVLASAIFSSVRAF